MVRTCGLRLGVWGFDSVKILDLSLFTGNPAKKKKWGVRVVNSLCLFGIGKKRSIQYDHAFPKSSYKKNKF